MLHGMQEWVVSMLQNLYSSIQDSDTIFDFFSPEFPKKKYMKFLDLPEKS